MLPGHGDQLETPALGSRDRIPEQTGQQDHHASITTFPPRRPALLGGPPSSLSLQHNEHNRFIFFSTEETYKKLRSENLAVQEAY